MGDLEGDYAPKYEMILFVSNGSQKLQGNRDANIIKMDKTDNHFHPTQKPEKLIAYLLMKSGNKNSKVFDPFIGSGTTAVAAKSLGLNFIGCEIEIKYYDICVKRLSQVQTDMFGIGE